MIALTKEIPECQLEWRNNPKIYAWTRQNGILSASDHEKWLEKIKEDPTIQMFGISSQWSYESLNEGEAIGYVGTCGFTSISHIHGTAEFSLFVGPEFQGRGYGKKALQELLKYGFKHLRLNTIWGETFVDNPAYRMFLSLGFQSEGRLRERYFKDGDFQDTYMISITEKEAKEQSWY